MLQCPFARHSAGRPSQPGKRSAASTQTCRAASDSGPARSPVHRRRALGRCYPANTGCSITLARSADVISIWANWARIMGHPVPSDVIFLFYCSSDYLFAVKDLEFFFVFLNEHIILLLNIYIHVATGQEANNKENHNSSPCAINSIFFCRAYYKTRSHRVLVYGEQWNKCIQHE